ncbi:cytosolic phospholipase A2 zeta [Salvelinus alpinus]|uniref:cytosolic phospholipase A2 zeta n=1 Tax=Salvelinus sp. IW2-2015 TaxID=2691554 RepID=UPI000CDF9759|nr:cytosolic phospholipase A2 zeta [Salvelinus alpinus]
MLKREVKTYQSLTVTVLRAINNCSHDYWSESDCYVTVGLPTASARTFCTKTVPNSKTPEWNESFQFRVHSHVKNIIELKMYDEDSFIGKGDDLCSIVVFDINNLTPGKKKTKTFICEPTKDELWVEFELLESKEPAGEYLSNGVLVASPFSTVDVNVEKLMTTAMAQNVVLKMRGAFPEEHKILAPEKTSNLTKTLRYYINRDLETELCVRDKLGEVEDPNVTGLSTALHLPASNDFKVSLPVGEDMVDLHLRTEDCPDIEFKVRLDFDIPPEEKEFLKKRKVLVGQALRKELGLTSPPDPKKLPVIAVVGSGGGTRAMTGLYGSLKGLQRLGLLDAVSYITGVSGSTWALAALYQEADWSQRDMDESISAMEEEITKCFLSAFTTEKLQYYKHQMAEKEKEGHMVSLIDMWGLVIEHCLHGKKKTSTLSDQQKAVSEGQNPLPICTAVNLKDGVKGTTTEFEWCEFTPYEVGFQKYGAYVHAEDFGSEFYLGHLVKKHPEIHIASLLGLWSSVFSLNLTQLWDFATGGQTSWSTWLGEDVNKIENDNEPTTLDTYLFKPITNTASSLTSLFTSRPVITQIYNFMRGFFLHRNYKDNRKFTSWKDMHPDAFPNRLTPADPTLYLADSGFSINTGCPPVLRPERGVDVIMSLNYSWCEDQFKVLKRTEVYCKDHSIPFPRIDFSSLEAQPLKELYVFEDEKNPKAPIVLHFPFVNISFKEFKAPGVARKGEEEMKAGDVDISSSSSPYLTKHLTYTVKDFRALIDLTSYNIQNNKEQILQALGKVLERKVPVEE